MITLSKAVETKDIVQALQDRGLTQQTIATATGATERSVRNWRRSSAILPVHEQRLRDLQEVTLILQDVLTKKGVDQWLRAKHRLLGGRRAVDVLGAGDPQAVKDAALAYAEGVYV